MKGLGTLDPVLGPSLCTHINTMQTLHRYDSHRDAILRSGETHQAGGDGGVTPGQRPTDEVDPFQYFSTACFSGYNDGAKVSQPDRHLRINMQQLAMPAKLRHSP